MSIKKTPLFAESWTVAWRKKSAGSILSDNATPFIVIKNNIRYWAADPFLLSFQNRIFVFAELYDYCRCRGIIGYCEIIDNKPTKWKPAIVEDYHLSFPNIFQQNEEIFIMPESNAAKELYIYHAVDFPNKWEKIKVLRSDFQCADTVVINGDGNEFALTYEVSDPKRPELWLLDLENEQNDKRLDFDNMELRRPAGKVLSDMNIRSAQNCTDDYGKGLIFYKYSFKNGEYSENESIRINPEDIALSHRVFLDGMHTYNFLNDYEVIDIKTRRFNIINLFFRIKSKFKKKD